MKIVDALVGFWIWLHEDLKFTRAGRLAFVAVLILGVAGAVADAASNSEHGDQAGAVLFVFVCMILAAVWLIDAAFRVARSILRRAPER